MRGMGAAVERAGAASDDKQTLRAHAVALLPRAPLPVIPGCCPASGDGALHGSQTSERERSVQD